MRLWSLHPKYLDAKGLVALWREALLAQAVLRGKTRGYTRHPQLLRFCDHPSPAAAIARYLSAVHGEACRRGYQFSAGKIGRRRARSRLAVSRGQISWEWRHLLRKLRRRDPERWKELKKARQGSAHPIFRVVSGGRAEWEKGS